MNRNEEYRAMLEELNRPVPGLEGTLYRARRKRKKKITGIIVRPLAGLAACFVIFVLLVNFCVPVAYACSQLPVLRELAESVTFSKSLLAAVENEYVQPMNLSQSENEITAEIDYLIIDQKQVNVFYRLHSDRYTQLAADPDVNCADEDLAFSVSSRNLGEENGELRSVSIDFVNEDVPDQLQFDLHVYSYAIYDNEVPMTNIEDSMISDEIPDGPRYLADFEFLLEFDPKFTAAGKVFPVNQTVILEGQAITITDIEVYPTHMRVDIQESAGNTAWLKGLDFYIETDWGMKFEPVSNGITATGSEGSPSMVSYRADSTYFYAAEHLRLVITGAEWLRKDMGKTYVNLVTGEHGALPEGAVFEAAERQGKDWIVIFRANWESGEPMYQLFGHTFFDADGKEYEINQTSSIFGDADENGNVTYFYDKFPLKNYPYDEVWLSPLFSHSWAAESPIVITIQ